MEDIDDLELSIYLFGSFSKMIDANDIDIVIVYNAQDMITATRKILLIKDRFHRVILSKFKLPTHFTTLSKEEVKEFEERKDINLIDLYEY